MTTALKSISGGKQQTKKPPSEEKTIRPHCKISIEDADWVLQQVPSVQQLYLECIRAEQYGGAAHELKTNLTYKSFQKASAVLSAQGLFQFEELFGRLPSGRPGLIGYRVRNLHGYYNRFYWESSTSEETNSCDEKAVHAGEEINQPGRNENHPKVEQIHAPTESFQKNGQKSEELQGLQKPNNVSNYPLTTYQQPTKVVGMVVGSDAPTENSRVDETAHAPLGGASPQPVCIVKEKEQESPTVMDCTTRRRVDDAPSQFTTFTAENQNSGVEPKDCHVRAASRREGVCSAAPGVPALQNLTNSEILNILDAANQGVCPDKGAIAALLETPHSRSLMAAITNNPQWGINLSDYSTVPQQIAQNSKLREQRLSRLKSYAAMGECPPDEFLQECLSDPVLKIHYARMASLKLW
ncbi:MAG: hypothetical protein HWQ38_38025 [Nostoc sp. NMS7]|uniref:hypothetical protein n=1 Tax=Nostoc sp. NMS7 TaxID=2815391 RepID=UPI0025E2576E|nr:hypothetical protein [Nostoc sp. NMS7]MBN3951957.1 hypothetical protein [Nostoc sp. NMS7]